MKEQYEREIWHLKGTIALQERLIKELMNTHKKNREADERIRGQIDRLMKQLHEWAQ